MLPTRSKPEPKQRLLLLTPLTRLKWLLSQRRRTDSTRKFLSCRRNRKTPKPDSCRLRERRNKPRTTMTWREPRLTLPELKSSWKASKESRRESSPQSKRLTTTSSPSTSPLSRLRKKCRRRVKPSKWLSRELRIGTN